MEYDSDLKDLESGINTKSKSELAKRAVDIAVRQIMTCQDFKTPRINQLNKYWRLYDGKTDKKLRQLFNVPIPVFAGMIDTLNAQYDTPITMEFKEGDPSDYFKVQKINGAFQKEIMNSAHNSKWDSKLRMARKHAIMNGRAILEYSVTSDPEYNSELHVVNLKNFNFQPKGGLYLENHLFAGTEDVEKTKAEIDAGVKAGIYDKEQVAELYRVSGDQDYLPFEDITKSTKIERFKPLGLDEESNSYVGSTVYKLANHVIELDGKRYYLCFHPWSRTWLRFERLTDIDSSDLMPWVSYATHEDDENFLSKSYADDLYPSADAIVAMFNQELTNREKRNFGARAYDKDMFPDVRKLDEAMHRPDALVPVDTKGGTRRLSDGIFEFKTGELQGTVNLIDWITSSLGRNTGATDLAMGGVQEVSKKASVTFAEQKSVSKRIGWGAQPFQDMMADLGQRFIFGLKDHMPAKMAIRLLGNTGYEWDEITRLDLNTKKDVDVLIYSRDQQIQDSEIKSKRRAEALALVDPMTINPQWRTEEILRSIGEYDDEEVANALDTQTYGDRKSIAKASEAIQMVLRGEKPEMWYGANTAFIQKIIDFANDKRSSLKDKFVILMDYAMAHEEIAMENIEKKVAMQSTAQNAPMAQQMPPGGMPTQDAEMPKGLAGGMANAMNLAEQAV